MSGLEGAFHVLTGIIHFEPRIQCCGDVQQLLSVCITVFFMMVIQDPWFEWSCEIGVIFLHHQYWCLDEVENWLHKGGANTLLSWEVPYEVCQWAECLVDCLQDFNVLPYGNQAASLPIRGENTWSSLLLMYPLDHSLFWSPSRGSLRFKLVVR